MLIKISGFLLVSVAIYLVIALGLVFSQASTKRMGEEGLDFSRQVGRAVTEAPALEEYAAADGQALHFRTYQSNVADAPLLVLVHGSGWHGLALDDLARKISSAGFADVVVPDLRGHGTDPYRRGDVDHIGQLEDDLHALIELERKPGQKIILAGHSSGGGLVIRYAGGKYGSDMDGAILLAPFLKYNAPTTRPGSGGWARPLTRRIIGLSMLNLVGITVFNHLPVIDFAFPDAVLNGPLGETATTSYSYRLNQSFAPRNDYLSDISKLPPYLLVAGRQDEAFIADLYEPTMSAVNGNGTYKLLDGVSHLDVMYEPETFDAVAAYIAGLNQK